MVIFNLGVFFFPFLPPFRHHMSWLERRLSVLKMSALLLDTDVCCKGTSSTCSREMYRVMGNVARAAWAGRVCAALRRSKCSEQRIVTFRWLFISFFFNKDAYSPQRERFSFHLGLVIQRVSTFLEFWSTTVLLVFLKLEESHYLIILIS